MNIKNKMKFCEEIKYFYVFYFLLAKKQHAQIYEKEKKMNK